MLVRLWMYECDCCIGFIVALILILYSNHWSVLEWTMSERRHLLYARRQLCLHLLARLGWRNLWRWVFWVWFMWCFCPLNTAVHKIEKEMWLSEWFCGERCRYKLVESSDDCWDWMMARQYDVVRRMNDVSKNGGSWICLPCIVLYWCRFVYGVCWQRRRNHHRARAIRARMVQLARMSTTVTSALVFPDGQAIAVKSVSGC